MSFENTELNIKQEPELLLDCDYEPNPGNAEYTIGFLDQTEIKPSNECNPGNSHQVPKRTNECINCKQVFDCPASLSEHLTPTKSSTKWCEGCTTNFPSLECYLNHIDAIHLSVKPIVCSQCPKKPSFDAMHKWELHHQERHFAFYSSPKFLIQINRKLFQYTLMDETPRTCPHCKEVRLWKMGLKRHIAQVHARPIKRPYCSLCHTWFENQLALDFHDHHIHSNSKRYNCDICGRIGFKRMSLLENHMRRHALKCSICNFVYDTRSKLQTHIYYCKKKPRGSHFNRRFKCDYCLRFYTSRVYLNRHTLRCPKNNNKEPSAVLQCEYCPRHFKNERGLEHHLAMKCKRIPVGREGKCVECSVCGHTFAKDCELESHTILMHNPSAPFPCADCHCRFFQKTQLLRHQCVSVH